MYIHRQFPDYEAMSAYTAGIIVNALKEKPGLVLCMASGHTPSLTCDQIVEQIRERQVDHSGLTFIGLDEWVGLEPSNTGSCRYFFEQKLIRPLGLTKEQLYLFDGLSSDPDGECRKMDDVIHAKGIDLMVVGIGMNGHIGFNEPDTPFDVKCHVADLEETTVKVGQKYFSSATALGKGITVGLGHLMHAKQLILIANGAHKKEVVEKAMHGPVDTAFPASIIQLHPNALAITDPL